MAATAASSAIWPGVTAVSLRLTFTTIVIARVNIATRNSHNPPRASAYCTLCRIAIRTSMAR